METTITKRITMPIGHRLLNYEGGCKNVHGHNITIELTFASRSGLDKSGFIIDFNDVKNGIGRQLKGLFDHAFLVNAYDDSMIEFLSDQGMKYFIMPKKEASSFEMSVGQSNPTVENLSEVVREMAETFCYGKGIHLKGVKIYESETGWVHFTN